MELDSFIEDKLNHYAQTIIDGTDRRDEHALGELYFYIALRRVTSGHGTTQDVGMMDAINDTLEKLGLIEPGKKFYIYNGKIEKWVSDSKAGN